MDITDGEGTLTIVGGATRINQIREIKYLKNSLVLYELQMCVSNSNKKKFNRGGSPKVLQSKHEIKTSLGNFSFAKNSVTTRKIQSGTLYNDKGVVILTYQKKVKKNVIMQYMI